MKVTPQRLAVYAALMATPEHPSPEEIYQTVRTTMPTVSLATVYKTLETLEQHGLASQVARLHVSKRYDANLEPHHHLICTVCRKISDIRNEALDAIAPPADLSGFVPTEVNVQIFGLCISCAARATPTEENNG